MKTRKLSLALIAAIVTSATASADTIEETSTVGNSDAKATILFRSQAITDSDPFMANHYHAVTKFEATGKVLGKNITFLDIGSKGYNHDGGYDPIKQRYVPGHSRAKVWFNAAGIDFCNKSKESSAKYDPAPISQSIFGVTKDYGVGPFTITVDCGVSLSMGPFLKATSTHADREAWATGNMEGAVTASASGEITAGGLGGISITSEIDLVSVEPTVEAEASPQVEDVSIFVRINALTLRLILEAWLLDGSISWDETLINKTFKSWTIDL